MDKKNNKLKRIDSLTKLQLQCLTKIKKANHPSEQNKEISPTEKPTNFQITEKLKIEINKQANNLLYEV